LRERYRVIAVFAETDRAQAVALEPLLGPNDELLPAPDRSFPALINAGRARARTPWLMLTEGHCIAQPGALDEVMRWVEANPDAQIGNFELIHISRNIVNRMVARWYDQTLAQWRTPPNWEHAISAGFAIRASVLDEVGPMQPAFGAFAPFVQSARLHSRGVKVADVPGAKSFMSTNAAWSSFATRPSATCAASLLPGRKSTPPSWNVISAIPTSGPIGRGSIAKPQRP
jgi:hypothetical protein